MHQRTANRLASYIEKETNGEISASYLLSPPKDFMGRNLEGVSLVGEDLSNFDFTNANLNDANLSNCNLQDATFALAKLQGANLSSVDAARTDFRSADFTGSDLSCGSFVRCKMHNIEAQSSVLNNTFINRTWFTGANFQSAEFVNVTWNTWGSFCRGIVLPEFNPNQIQKGHDCNDVVAGLLLYEFPEDFEIRQVCEFIVSRLFHRCWQDLVERMLEHYEHTKVWTIG